MEDFIAATVLIALILGTGAWALQHVRDDLSQKANLSANCVFDAGSQYSTC